MTSPGRDGARGDAVYYDASGRVPLAARLSLIARRRIYHDFLTLARPQPGEAILDVGVSAVVTGEANILEQMYPHREDITCAGLGDGAAVLAAYPGVRFVAINADAPLPFADGAFAIATANAVLEHVGGKEQQSRFLGELLRVGRRVFVSIPNRWFPVEHHTALPLLHYCPPLFRAVCRGGDRDHWARPENLAFLSAREFHRLWPGAARVVVRSSGLPLGPLSSNLVALASYRGSD